LGIALRRGSPTGVFCFLFKHMAAQNTDKFIKVTSNKGWQLGAGGIPDATATSFPLVSADDIPTDTAVIVTVDRVDANKKPTPSKMERIVGVVSGDNITNCIRGFDGTAQQHSAGAVVEIVIAKGNWNRVMEGILAEHGQDGKHNQQKLDEGKYAADSGASDSYAITLSPAPAAYYAGMVVVFKANTVNTGPATLNVNGLGAKTIKKNHDQDLADGDIESGQIVEVVYDGTNFQMQSQSAIAANPVIFAMQRRSGVQSIPNVTVTKILTNTADKTVGDIKNDTANSRIVINKAGFYRLSLYLGFSDSTAGQYRIPGFRLNGVTVLDVYYAKTTGVGSIRMTGTHYLQLSASDYIEISGYQDSGGNLNVMDGTYFVVERMSD
jgi:hypothetical protein